MAKGKAAGKRLILPDGYEDLAQGDDRDENDIELATQARNHVPNYQCLDGLTRKALAEQRDIDRKYRTVVDPRTEPNPLYNCHGMTFASRRTMIIEDSAILQILKEDKYVVVPKDEVMPGDIVLYFSPKGGIEHSGIVVELPDERNPLEYPRIVSKWGIGREYVHRVNQCDYPLGDIRYYRNS